jgi:DNA-binding transcriptional regulator YhcF (GntR family)
MSNGWICLHRCIQKHWIWQDANRFKWWVDLLLRANYEDKKVLIESRLVECKRGVFITSLCNLAKEWGVSRDVVRHFLTLLESDGMITRKVTTKYTQITICNYDSYQDKATTEPQQTHNRATTEPQQTHTNNNNNNDNNNNILSNESSISSSARTQKGVKKKAFTPPTIEEVEQYCKERQNGINASDFIDHYEANGWKVGKGGLPMKDWQAAIRNWEKYNRNGNNSTSARVENNPVANQQWRDPQRTQEWNFTDKSDFD